MPCRHAYVLAGKEEEGGFGGGGGRESPKGGRKEGRKERCHQSFSLSFPSNSVGGPIFIRKLTHGGGGEVDSAIASVGTGELSWTGSGSKRDDDKLLSIWII